MDKPHAPDDVSRAGLSRQSGAERGESLGIAREIGLRTQERPHHILNRLAPKFPLRTQQVFIVLFAIADVREAYGRQDMFLAGIEEYAVAGCSPRILQHRSHEVIGKTPIDELRERRLEHVCEMLVKTTNPIDLIGGFCGFASNSNLKSAFRSRYGMSLSDYRAGHA